MAQTIAGVVAADIEVTTSCSASGSPLASGVAVPAEAVMTHFNSSTVFGPASDCSMTSGSEVTRATNVALLDSGTDYFGRSQSARHWKPAGSARRLEGCPTR